MLLKQSTFHYRLFLNNDMDFDGDIDVLSSASNNEEIIWHENTDGLGSFDIQHTITTGLDGVISVYASDLDGDDDLDIISASGENKIAWYENINGLGDFGAQQEITTNVFYPSSVYVIDIDSDGDLDILSASEGDDKIAYYDNEISKIEIHNSLGQLFLSNSDKNEINVSVLSNGLYYCKVVDKKGAIGVKKIYKQ